jgi:hypothetical protein
MDIRELESAMRDHHGTMIARDAVALKVQA